MKKDCIRENKLEETGFNYTMSLIQGKYKLYILYTLACYEIVRFNEMKRYIGDITYKTLSNTLKELESDRLVNRKEYPQIPPKVEYSLTERGKSLMPILDLMCEWARITNYRIKSNKFLIYYFSFSCNQIDGITVQPVKVQCDNISYVNILIKINIWL